MSSGEESFIDTSISDPEVAEKFKLAGEIADQVLNKVVSQCKPGKGIALLCTRSDNLILKKLSLCKFKECKNGIAFPTSISFGEMTGDYSPLEKNDQRKIQNGDLLKIDLGVHIDGYPAIVCYPIVVGNSETNPITGEVADLFEGGEKIMEQCIENFRPGKTNFDITELVEKIAKEYGINPVSQVYSHSMQRNTDEGERKISMCGDGELDLENVIIQENETFTLDVLMTTGSPKKFDDDVRTTIFKRDPEANYQLQSRVGRQVFSYIRKNKITFPFHIKSLSSFKNASFACNECTKAGLFIPYEVEKELNQKPIINFKATICVLNDSTIKISGISTPKLFIKSNRNSENNVETEKNENEKEKVNEKEENTSENKVEKKEEEKKETEEKNNKDKGRGKGRGRGRGRGKGKGKGKGKGRGRGKRKGKGKKKKGKKKKY
ncbi:proliferation-associated protein 2g4 [Anaeramoeba flamelloides]|uniref:Proliferation-associated protein 2g4 n=1 Tax=Anaeramoeba flamelloides TaxID=1746091 RepID=A0AAV7Z6H3_9EUKA|nr:proliferation-associated protein 2g4 [Anaeramoeba flamelloides]